MYQRTDAERLFRHLVLTRILSEELVIGLHEQVISYVKLGPRALELFEGKFKVHCFSYFKFSFKIFGTV